MKKEFDLESGVTTAQLPKLLGDRSANGWDFVAIIPTGRVTTTTWDLIFSRAVRADVASTSVQSG
jgi:hypothetical protein